jgi:uncharacterized protein
MHEERSYRKLFNTSRFRGFEAKYHETDLWIGIDTDSYIKEMEDLVNTRIRELRHQLDAYIISEPEFALSLDPFMPSDTAPSIAKDMARAASKAGIGPMASVAGLFARETADAIRQNFSVKELVIENGGDIFVLLNRELVLSVYAGNSPLSEKIGLVIPPDAGVLGICTSSGTIGPSLSLGNSDAVAIVCRDVLLADAFATALANRVKAPDDINKVLDYSERFPEILSVVIICAGKTGMRGNLDVKFLKQN